MTIFDYLDDFGKNNIKATKDNYINNVGEEGLKDIIRMVFEGGNVRDYTEFITQRRLLNSYAATLELFIKRLSGFTNPPDKYVNYVSTDFSEATGNAKIFDLYLLGLTKKGLDNIVRGEENFNDYKQSFLDSFKETVEDMNNHFGTLSGAIRINGKYTNVSWELILLLFVCIGSQSLSIRGSSKSMNGKLFEKLVLGTLLSIMDFEFRKNPPKGNLDINKKYFWLSHMDEHERETDATLIYNKRAISVDIGFIGRGNPEITLDKVTRFERFKEIAKIEHEMNTIIIVDTLPPNSDLQYKANKVGVSVFEMKEPDWTIQFANKVKEIFKIEDDLKLSTLRPNELDNFFREKIKAIKINKFLEKRN